MLFTDRDYLTTADLVSLDPQILAVAMAEKISLTAVINTGVQEMGNRIIAKGVSFAGFIPPFVNPWSQTAAALNLVGPSAQRPRYSISQIVVSSPYPGLMSPFKRATAYMALIELYSQAYYRKMEDRYEKRMDMHADALDRKHWPYFWNQGVPIINQPMACPGAVYEPYVGTFDNDSVTVVAGRNANANPVNYDVAISWIDGRFWTGPIPPANGNAESGPSATVTTMVNTAQVMQISIANLTAPSGQTPVSIAQGQGLYTPLSASGWLVYAGVQGGTLYLQTSTPIPYATKTYTFTGNPTLTGLAVGSGQYYNSSYTLQNMLMRG